MSYISGQFPPNRSSFTVPFPDNLKAYTISMMVFVRRHVNGFACLYETSNESSWLETFMRAFGATFNVPPEDWKEFIHDQFVCIASDPSSLTRANHMSMYPDGADSSILKEENRLVGLFWEEQMASSSSDIQYHPRAQIRALVGPGLTEFYHAEPAIPRYTYWPREEPHLLGKGMALPPSPSPRWILTGDSGLILSCTPNTPNTVSTADLILAATPNADWWDGSPWHGSPWGASDGRDRDSDDGGTNVGTNDSTWGTFDWGNSAWPN
ncbi:hypothetical protein BDZ89DRAFT_1144620 [Hymenopellis radicata]|nr:hypothetical protein BDZ89DRAFT_1144620 [Hymenopellis radicata]